MRLGTIATALLLTCLLPAAAAQAPAPEDLTALACVTLDGPAPQAHDLLPFCPRADPAQAPPADEHDHGAVPAPEAPAPQAAEDLAANVVERVEAIPEDPAGAPERVAEIVALVVQFVKDLIDLPANAAKAVGAAFAAAGDAVKAAAGAIGDATKGAAVSALEGAKGAIARVAALFDHAAPESAPAPRLPTRAPVKVPDVRLPIDLGAIGR